MSGEPISSTEIEERIRSAFAPYEVQFDWTDYRQFDFRVQDPLAPERTLFERRGIFAPDINTVAAARIFALQMRTEAKRTGTLPKLPMRFV